MAVLVPGTGQHGSVTDNPTIAENDSTRGDDDSTTIDEDEQSTATEDDDDNTT
ncbi:hypothetical protein LTR47_002803 [Exophiala xenobiotica]|nr:hypothetical protein LTR92_004851 [Exophiala xenobiotica]KAK5209911.1 hypothetical protein LTR41_004543 [Exophiala xenobiotica]KAK5225786.1 hypothetical protein LTR72_003689 [Exophiala xenobiotica]KAK5236077.1 hypothetical protein LTR47_002803 [Exophiala xenobiotica]KAK5253785.1 hypothetical protein LTS06_001914 [Exophiala xenobiotica]